MTGPVALCLALAVAFAWIAALALWRLRTALERLHTVTFANIVGGCPVLLAAWLTDGLSPRALKCAAIWLATVLVGALLSHVIGHALHIRDGERR